QFVNCDFITNYLAKLISNYKELVKSITTQTMILNPPLLVCFSTTQDHERTYLFLLINIRILFNNLHRIKLKISLNVTQEKKEQVWGCTPYKR
ncbi:Hypothetical predicted protein, partial [Olea europaea subsp. europaea]